MGTLLGRVKSSVTMGHNADWEKVAIAVEGGVVNVEEKRSVFERVLLQFKLVVDEPERNMFSAVDVKLAIGLAAGGSG